MAAVDGRGFIVRSMVIRRRRSGRFVSLGCWLLFLVALMLSGLILVRVSVRSISGGLVLFTMVVGVVVRLVICVSLRGCWMSGAVCLASHVAGGTFMVMATLLSRTRIVSCIGWLMILSPRIVKHHMRETSLPV